MLLFSFIRLYRINILIYELYISEKYVSHVSNFNLLGSDVLYVLSLVEARYGIGAFAMGRLVPRQRAQYAGHCVRPALRPVHRALSPRAGR